MVSELEKTKKLINDCLEFWFAEYPKMKLMTHAFRDQEMSVNFYQPPGTLKLDLDLLFTKK